MSSHEADVLARYSTPGLRKNQLDRAAKKDSLLASYGKTYPREDIEKVLNELYPPTTNPQEET